MNETEILRREKWLTYLLASIQFVHILDFVVLMPLGPMLMRTFHVTPSQFGLLVSSYTFSAGISNFLASIVADRFERKRMLQVCFTGFLLGTLSCGLANSFFVLLMTRIIAGAFGGVLNAVVFALIPDLIPPQRRGAATGIVMSAFSVSSVIGVPIGLALAERFGWHATFFFIVCIGILSLLSASVQLPLVNNRGEPKSAAETMKQFAGIATEAKHVEGFLLTSFLAFGMFMLIPFISPSMVRNVGLAESQLKYIYICGGLTTVFSARWIGRLCDRHGAYRVFSALVVLSTIPIVTLTHLGHNPIWLVLCCTTFFMMTSSARFIPAMTMLSLVVDPKKRGTFMGLENALRQLASGCSSLIAGLIIYEAADGRLVNFDHLGYVAIGMSAIAWVFARKVHKGTGVR